MRSSDPKGATLLVTYALTGDASGKLYEATVSVRQDLADEAIVPALKQDIRPWRSPDPSDNYPGQKPADVVIVNVVNLSKLL